jgi:pimeloyl-ACP methyl ester carboxylesterase/predicted Ser/Thr protein kinase
MIGTLLSNRYRIDAPLGEGGMGIVYRAYDTLLDRAVAIKSLSSHYTTPEGLKRLLREAQAAAKLTHPGIVATYDVLEDGDGRFIVMELVEGKTLRELIPLPWREANDVMRGVFEAIGFAHERGIIHRDLKPENIIVTADGTAKIMDFGLARSEGGSRMTQTGMVVGTATYMAPEQALRGKAVPQSDLYALGCVFYELLTGQPPFPGEDPLAIITQHINMPPRTPRHTVPDLPPGLEALILKLLAKDPSERPRSGGEVARMLTLMQTTAGSVEGLLVESPRSELTRSSRMVGRTEIVRKMLERLDRLMAGSGGAVVISGEPGIGKTRLLEEVIAAARLRGFQVLSGRCHERDAAVPYVPVADALENYARRLPPAQWEKVLAAAGPDVAVLLADDTFKNMLATPVVRADTGTLKVEARPARALRNLLTEVTQATPVLLAFDDLHWADGPSLELIQSLAVYTREIPVLMVGAYREIELERAHPLSRLLVDLNRERLLTRERLRRLNLADTRRLLEGLLGGEAPEGLSELFFEQTEGNPFFLEELTNSLIEDGKLLWNAERKRYELASGTTAERLAGEIPQGIRAAIGARLDRLEPPVQQILSLASIVGRHFSSEILTRLAGSHGLSEDDVEHGLAAARSARFISSIELDPRQDDVAGFTAGSPDIEADFVFDHPLIHQVVYAEIDRRRKRRLHGEVGHVLEHVFRGRESMYAERLAFHFLESDDDGKAVEYCLRAGDKILRGYYDPHMALIYYLHALEMVIGKEPALRRLTARSPVPLRHGAGHRFSSDEQAMVVEYLGEIIHTARDTPAAGAVAQLGTRICVAAMHSGPVYDASIRLYEVSILGPDVQKLIVDTPYGRLAGILEFPGPGGPVPLVMILHGSGGTKESMAEVAKPYLSRGMAALRVDLPGFGETTVSITGTLRDVEVLKEMMTAVLDNDRVDERGIGIAGWSLGPWYGAQLCARDGRVRALVSISGAFNPLDPRPGVAIPEEIRQARFEAQWKAGKRPSPGPLQYAPDTSVYDVAHQIKCPILLAYGALEPAVFRAQAEELAALVPTAETKVWRSGVHVLLNVPEAFEHAADWMREQLVGQGHKPT